MNKDQVYNKDGHTNEHIYKIRTVPAHQQHINDPQEGKCRALDVCTYKNGVTISRKAMIRMRTLFCLHSAIDTFTHFPNVSLGFFKMAL